LPSNKDYDEISKINVYEKKMMLIFSKKIKISLSVFQN
jgi:hypothetical protein